MIVQVRLNFVTSRSLLLPSHFVTSRVTKPRFLDMFCCTYSEFATNAIVEAVKNGHGCYINKFDDPKQALIESARTGNLAALKFLFHIRCFNARYNWVEVCNTCVVYNQVECLRFLTTLNLKYARCNLGQDPIYEAILRDRLECLKILVAAGFEIEDGEFGHLWMAEAMKSKNCAKYLVSLGYKSVDWIAVHRSFELEVREKETCCKICVLANVITYECMSCNKSACGECILKYFEELTCMHCGEQYSYLNVRYLPIYAVEYKKYASNSC